MADLKMVLEKTNDLKWKIDSVLRFSTYVKKNDGSTTPGIDGKTIKW